MFNSRRSTSCAAADAQDNRIEPEDLNKDAVRQMLEEYYRKCLKPQYKFGYVDLDGQGNSESQSYALLQSVMVDDERTFGRVWDWTDRNLQRGDNLFAWNYDLKHNFVSFPIKRVSIKDDNPATDADSDIARALFMAAEKWDKQEYIDEAREIINGIWNREVVEYNGRLYLLPGPWGADENRIVLNPSYFSPAAYHLFSKYDSGHDWNKLAGDSYLNLKDIQQNVDRGENGVLPPNWVQLNKSTNQISPFEGKADSYDYSYDAFRTLWRAGYDQLKSPTPESWEYVSSFKIFEEDWNDDQYLCIIYRFINGELVCDPGSTGLAGSVGIYSVTNGHVAEQIIKRYYLHNNKLQFPEANFYGGSWHWFATWLWSQS